MATAVAGLMEGEITVNSTIVDTGPYDKYVKEGSDAPACWIKPYYSSHGRQNVVAALKNSCNYFFFEVADRLGIERLTNWVGKLGLTSKTLSLIHIYQPGNTLSAAILRARTGADCGIYDKYGAGTGL